MSKESVTYALFLAVLLSRTCRSSGLRDSPISSDSTTYLDGADWNLSGDWFDSSRSKTCDCHWNHHSPSLVSFKNVTTIQPRSCCSVCWNTPGCVSYDVEVFEWTTNCMLSRSPFGSCAPKSCSMSQDTDYNPGSPGVSPPVSTRSPQECCRACEDLGAVCAGSVFVGATRECQFKSLEDLRHPVSSSGRTGCSRTRYAPSHGRYSVPATVPGDVITDLERAGLVPDPLSDYNWLEHEHMWDVPVTLAKRFLTPDDCERSSEVLLVFEGVKMGARVVLNGREVGLIVDQFLRYAFPVGGILRPARSGEWNELSVVFDPEIDVRGRFMSCSGGWDWAPFTTTVDQHGAGTMSKGIWKSVYLAAVRSAAITHVAPRVLYDGPYPTSPLTDALASGHFAVQTDIYLYAPAPVRGVVSLSGDCLAQTLKVDVALDQGENHVHFDARARSAVLLWWPNEMGDRTLYSLRATFSPSSGNPVVAERRIGFRYVSLVTYNDTDPEAVRAAPRTDGSGGHTMMLRVNGAAMFAMGANLIPMEELEGRASARGLRILVESAAQAHFNMLRIWGGGIVQYDEFYDACDELGVLVYHDMMFAQGNHAPSASETERAEIVDILRRLSHHPSIAMWDGCNECDGKGLIQDFVMPVVASEDATRPVWSSCPSVGWRSGVRQLDSLPNGRTLIVGGSINETHGYYLHGSGSAWKAVNGDFPEWDFDPLMVPATDRTPVGPSVPGIFASEFGSVVMSSFESMSATLDPKHWSLHSKPLAERNYPCDSLITSYFGPQDLDSVGERPFARSLYLCMLAQALYVKSDIETRRATNTWGVLTWQFNEIWPTGGWGSIEYGPEDRPGQVVGGRWKPLQHMMRQSVTAPVTATVTSGGALWVRNDLPAPFKGVWSVSLVHLGDGVSSDVRSDIVFLAPGAGSLVWTCVAPSNLGTCSDLGSVLQSRGCSPDGRDCVLLTKLFDGSTDTLVSYNLQMLVAPRFLKLSGNVSIAARVGDVEISSGTVPVTLSNRGSGAALFVTLTTTVPGVFSDNCVLVSPGSDVVVRFRPFLSVPDLPAALSRSLRVLNL